MTRYRLARTSDQAEVRAFLNRLSLSTVLARYLSPAISASELLREREVQRILDGKRPQHLVLVAVDGGEIRGVGELAVESADSADVGFVVEDAFQGRGIGRLLFRKLSRHALQRGVRTFTGDVAYGNSRALAILRGTGRRLQLEISYGTLHFTMSLTE